MFSTIEINLVLWFMAFVAVTTQSAAHAKGTILIGFMISSILQYWAYYTVQKESKKDVAAKQIKRKLSSGLIVTGWLLIVYGVSSFYARSILETLTGFFPGAHRPVSESQTLMNIVMALPRGFVAIGMFTGGIGVLRLKGWGRWLAIGMLLVDFCKKLFHMLISSYFNTDLSFSRGTHPELTVCIFFASLLLELLVLLYLMRPKVKEQFK